MTRDLLAIAACTLALFVGVVTSSISASNRLRGNRLDALQRWCEAQSRRNEKLRAENATEQWFLLSGEEEPVQAEEVPRADS